jgi:hypothetical protein
VRRFNMQRLGRENDEEAEDLDIDAFFLPGGILDPESSENAGNDLLHSSTSLQYQDFTIANATVPEIAPSSYGSIQLRGLNVPPPISIPTLSTETTSSSTSNNPWGGDADQHRDGLTAAVEEILAPSHPVPTSTWFSPSSSAEFTNLIPSESLSSTTHSVPPPPGLARPPPGFESTVVPSTNPFRYHLTSNDDEQDAADETSAIERTETGDSWFSTQSNSEDVLESDDAESNEVSASSAASSIPLETSEARSNGRELSLESSLSTSSFDENKHMSAPNESCCTNDINGSDNGSKKVLIDTPCDSEKKQCTSQNLRKVSTNHLSLAVEIQPAVRTDEVVGEEQLKSLSSAAGRKSVPSEAKATTLRRRRRNKQSLDTPTGSDHSGQNGQSSHHGDSQMLPEPEPAETKSIPPQEISASILQPLSTSFSPILGWFAEFYNATLCPLCWQLASSFYAAISLVLKYGLLVVMAIRNVIYFAFEEARISHSIQMLIKSSSSTATGRRKDVLSFASMATVVCYLVMYMTPVVCDWIMDSADLPHFAPHVISNVVLFLLCQRLDQLSTTDISSPSRRSMINAGSGVLASANFNQQHFFAEANRRKLHRDVLHRILRSLRWALPFSFYLEGFSETNASFMASDTPIRLILAYFLSLTRGGLLLSPLSWIGWSVQVLLASYLPYGYLLDVTLLLVGLAFVRLVDELQTGYY